MLPKLGPSQVYKTGLANFCQNLLVKKYSYGEVSASFGKWQVVLAIASSLTVAPSLQGTIYLCEFRQLNYRRTQMKHRSKNLPAQPPTESPVRAADNSPGQVLVATVQTVREHAALGTAAVKYGAGCEAARSANLICGLLSAF